MDLYQQLILDHSKTPVGSGLREPYDAQVHHVNPTCGDEVTLRVRVADGAVEDISYAAHGCSISVASTSILAEEVTGRPLTQALATYAAMKAMLTSRGQDQGDEEVLGDGIALAGVSRYPARVKCALLGWAAFTDALARSGVDIAAGSPPTDPASSTPQPAEPKTRAQELT